MKRRLILSLFYMGLVATIVSMLATVFVYQSTMSAEIKENLANELRLLKIGYEKLPKSENLKDFSAEDFRITLIDPSGKVLFESDADAEKMENHLDRPEIISALETGKGSDTRISSTLGAEDYYYAERLEDSPYFHRCKLGSVGVRKLVLYSCCNHHYYCNSFRSCFHADH